MEVDQAIQHKLLVGNAYARLFKSELGLKVLRLMIQQSGMIPDDVRPTDSYGASVRQGRSEFMADILMSCRDGGLKVDTLGGMQWTSGETPSPKDPREGSSDSTTSNLS